MAVITFNQHLEDVVAAAAYAGWEAPHIKRSRLLNKLMPVVIFLGVGLFLTARDGFHVEVWGAMGVMALITVFLMEPIARILQRRRLEKLVVSGQATHLVGERTVVVTPDLITLTIERKEMHYQPGPNQSLVELDEHLLLFVDKHTALIFPKRALGDAQERESLKAELSTFLANQVSPA